MASAEWFTIRSRDKALMSVRGSSAPSAINKADPAPSSIHLCIPRADKHLGILLPARPTLFQLTPRDIPAAAIPVRLDRLGPRDPTQFIHPFQPRRRLMQHEAANGEPARLAYETKDASDGGFDFWIEAADPATLPHALREQGGEIGGAIQLPLGWPNIVERLRAGSLRPALAEAILCCLPTDELRGLAQHLLDHDADRALFADVWPQDPWLAHRLPALAAWRRGDTAVPQETTIGEEAADLSGLVHRTAHRPCLGLGLTELARGGIAPKRLACLLGAARNEGPYLLDWIAHHRSIGFDHVLLYTNDNTDGSDDLLSALARAGIITWRRQEIAPGVLPQLRAYGHALAALPEILDYRWTLIADLDEYVGFHRTLFPSFRDHLAWHDMQRAEAVALPWALHIGTGPEGWRDQHCIARFPFRMHPMNHHIKSVFRTHLFSGANAHHPTTMFERRVAFSGDNGRPHRPLPPGGNPALSADPVGSHAWIAHYLFKSPPEVLAKLVRGRGDAPKSGRFDADAEETLGRYMKLRESSALAPDPRIADCAAGLAAERARLCALPGVAEADRAIRAECVRQLEAACRMFLDDPVSRSTPVFGHFRQLLADTRNQAAA